MRINQIKYSYINNFYGLQNKNVSSIAFTSNPAKKESLSSADAALKSQFEAAQKISSIQDKKHVKSKLFVLSGSSGVGKDTVLQAFLKNNPEYKFSVSHTTRPIRNGERDGVDYFFVTEEEFDKSVKNNEFLEWENFSGNKYGTKKDTIEKSLKNGDNIILKLDTKGALNIKKMFPEAVLIFIKPPSLEVLEARLRGRKTETEDAIQKRLGAIKTEMENAKLFDYVIVNDKVENAVSSLEKCLKKYVK